VISTNEIETQWADPVSLICHFALRKLYTEPSIGTSNQISINLAKWLWRRYFFIGQLQTRTAYGGHISCMIGTKYGILYRISHTSFLQSNNSLCLLVSEENIFLNFNQSETRIVNGDHGWSIRDEMMKSRGGPSTDASYKMLLYLATWFQRRRFSRNWPTRNNNCLWQPSFLQIGENDRCFLPSFGSFGKMVPEEEIF
jgi:hypothetical protein